MTSQGSLALAVFSTNVTRMTELRWEMLGVKMALASVAIFAHFAANVTRQSSCLQPNEIEVCQIFQSVRILGLQGIAAWKHYNQFLLG